MTVPDASQPQHPSPGAARVPAAGDRRRGPRQPERRSLTIELTGGDDAEVVECSVADASAIGIGLRMGRTLKGGQEFWVTVAAVGGIVVRALYRVVHSTPLDAGEFHVGAALIRVDRARTNGHVST